ncbi:unnamed protein product [Caenorhabditis brenneri]
MVQTRQSLGSTPNDRNAQQKRRSLESSPHQKVYPDLTETTSCAPTIQTSELQDEDDLYETEDDTSFASSHASDSSMFVQNEIQKYGAIFFGLILAAVLIGFIIRGHQVKTDASYENYIKSVRSTINNNFPTISKENRDLLRLIGQKTFLEPDNHSPLVILMGGKSAKELSEAINQAVQNAKPKHDTKKRTIRIESDTNRAELHKHLQEILGPSETSETSPRSAVVLDVDLLKWDAVLVLHAFADHEKYPVPKTVLLLTVSESNLSAGDSGSCDENMVRFLTTRWIENGGSSDNIPPIIARISYFLCV